MGYKTQCLVAHFRESRILPFAAELSSLFSIMQADFDVQVDYLNKFPWHKFSPKIQKVSAEDYNDPEFQKILLSQKDSAFLYTNGNIVPKELLQQDGFKILHIHPGIVPHVRGSDGLLWSIANRGKPGASCFYMSPGIDEGDLIDTIELPPMKIQHPAPKTTEEEELLYRAALIAFDPHIRAKLLCKILEKNKDKPLKMLPSHKQEKSEKQAFLWMHPILRRKVFQEKICV